MGYLYASWTIFLFVFPKTRGPRLYFFFRFNKNTYKSNQPTFSKESIVRTYDSWTISICYSDHYVKSDYKSHQDKQDHKIPVDDPLPPETITAFQTHAKLEDEFLVFGKILQLDKKI